MGWPATRPTPPVSGRRMLWQPCTQMQSSGRLLGPRPLGNPSGECPIRLMVLDSAACPWVSGWFLNWSLCDGQVMQATNLSANGRCASARPAACELSPLVCGCARRCRPRLPGPLPRGGPARRGNGVACPVVPGEVCASRSGGRGRSRAPRRGPGPGASRAWRRSAWHSGSSGGRRGSMTAPRRPPPRPGTC